MKKYLKIHDDIKTLLAKIGITYLRKGKFHQLHMDQILEDSDVSYMSLRLLIIIFLITLKIRIFIFILKKYLKIHDDIKTLLAKIGITYLRKGKFHLHMDQNDDSIEMLVKFIPYQSRQELIHEHNKR